MVAVFLNIPSAAAAQVSERVMEQNASWKRFDGAVQEINTTALSSTNNPTADGPTGEIPAVHEAITTLKTLDEIRVTLAQL